MRVDRLIVERALAPTRSAAQRLIEAGAVQWRAVPGHGDWRRATKAGEVLAEGCELAVTDDAELRWVSRGGLKLQGALERTGVRVEGRTALDVGQSTGGFTQVLLAAGVQQVVGVDVGHGQLHATLRSDPRVLGLEGLNARHLDAAMLQAAAAAAGSRTPVPAAFDLIVGDLSFISLTLVLPAVAALLAAEGDLLMLVKPQFELQPAQIGRGGLVRDPALHAVVEQRLRDATAEAGLSVQAWLDSPIAGGDGNTEFFLHARRSAAGTATWAAT